MSTEPLRMGVSGDHEVCRRCGGENVSWFAPSPLWNLVMRGNDIDGDALFNDLVCMRCFVVLANDVGVEGTWRLAVRPEPVGLILTTPTGRVWDADRDLWTVPTETPDAEDAVLMTEIRNNPEELAELERSRAQAERGEMRWLDEDEGVDPLTDPQRVTAEPVEWRVEHDRLADYLDDVLLPENRAMRQVLDDIRALADELADYHGAVLAHQRYGEGFIDGYVNAAERLRAILSPTTITEAT